MWWVFFFPHITKYFRTKILATSSLKSVLYTKTPLEIIVIMPFRIWPVYLCMLFYTSTGKETMTNQNSECMEVQLGKKKALRGYLQVQGGLDCGHILRKPISTMEAGDMQLSAGCVGNLISSRIPFRQLLWCWSFHQAVFPCFYILWEGPCRPCKVQILLDMWSLFTSQVSQTSLQDEGKLLHSHVLPKLFHLSFRLET